MGLLGIDVYIIRIFEYIRISYANIRIPISAFVDIPRKMTCNNHKLDLVNVDVHTKCQLVLKILRGNQILTSIKDCNSVKILRKKTGHNTKLDLVNVDVHTEFGQIMSIPSETKF